LFYDKLLKIISYLQIDTRKDMGIITKTKTKQFQQLIPFIMVDNYPLPLDKILDTPPTYNPRPV
jgi:hypothetical protein